MPPGIMPIPNPPYNSHHGPPSVIYAGHMRMGSLSLAHALARLGLRTHHGLEANWSYWGPLYRAADSVWTDQSAPFTRADWDEIFGTYDCTTDIGSLFVPQLLEAYPNAKVILVQRDFESWWRSFYAEVVAGNIGISRLQHCILRVVEVIIGIAPHSTMVKILQGYYGATTREEIQSKAHDRYLEHYAYVRRTVPKDRLLDFKLAEGWEPLCRFLGVEQVPEEPFPRMNESEERAARAMGCLRPLVPGILRRLAPWVVGMGVLVVAVAWRG